MPDDKRNPGRPDRDRIDVNEDYELRDWSKKFGVSKEELAAAHVVHPVTNKPRVYDIYGNVKCPDCGAIWHRLRNEAILVE